MKIFQIEINRQVTYWETAEVEIEAASFEEAKKFALEDAESGMLDFEHDEFPVVEYEFPVVEYEFFEVEND